MYVDIAGRLINKNGHNDQIKHYKVLLPRTMLDKLFKAYIPFISTIDKDSFDYPYADLRNTIHQMIWYLKNNPLKIVIIAFISPHSRKHIQINGNALLLPPVQLYRPAKNRFFFQKNFNIQLIDVGSYFSKFAPTIECKKTIQLIFYLETNYPYLLFKISRSLILVDSQKSLLW